jgi:signal transduction histidine kinase
VATYSEQMQPDTDARLEARLVRLGRDHPGWVDVGLLVAAAAASFASMFYVADLVGWWPALLLNGLPPLALIWRRRWPLAVLGVGIAVGLPQWWLAVPVNGVQVTSLIALYTVARRETSTRARLALGAALVVVLISSFRQPFTGVTSTVLAGLTVLLIHLIGSNIALRQVYLGALEERADRLERERDAAALAAAALERTRIARELHDVVAHHVSVMVVQAEGAGWAIDGEPEQARTAIATIARTGRSTLVELRRLLGVLRADGVDGAGVVAPQPGLTDLPALLNGFRGSGLLVDSAEADDVTQLSRTVPESLQLAAFRIVQEGLTNVLKHAGPTARATVRLAVLPASAVATGATGAIAATGSQDSARLLVEICDDGLGSAAETRSAETRSSGHGVVGIRERVALFEGRLDIGPRATGGFAVRAVLPIPTVHAPMPDRRRVGAGLTDPAAR